MRTLTNHTVDPKDKLVIRVGDEPGAGGANHNYRFCGLADASTIRIVFQDGPVKEHGINGVTECGLLAIVADRLRCFQEGPYATEENETALHCVEEALEMLHIRTRYRLARAVEGTSDI
jgi:hypothetical protein